MELEEEMTKLADLEFEYNIIDKFADDDAQRIIALSKYRKQLAKVRELQLKLEDGEFAQEELKQGSEDVSDTNEEELR